MSECVCVYPLPSVSPLPSLSLSVFSLASPHLSPFPLSPLSLSPLSLSLPPLTLSFCLTVWQQQEGQCVCFCCDWQSSCSLQPRFPAHHKVQLEHPHTCVCHVLATAALHSPVLLPCLPDACSNNGLDDGVCSCYPLLTDLVVDCTGAALSSIPQNIPLNTTTLYVEVGRGNKEKRAFSSIPLLVYWLIPFPSAPMQDADQQQYH